MQEKRLDSAFELVRATVEYVKELVGQPYQGPGDKLTRVRGILNEGDCGDVEVTVVSSEEGELGSVTIDFGQNSGQ